MCFFSGMDTAQELMIVNTQNPQLLGQIFSLMAVKANILAFSTVFKVTIIFMIIGAIAALQVKENKKDFIIKPEEPIEF